jgi:hypothetical protein
LLQLNPQAKGTQPLKRVACRRRAAGAPQGNCGEKKIVPPQTALRSQGDRPKSRQPDGPKSSTSRQSKLQAMPTGTPRQGNERRGQLLPTWTLLTQRH